MTNTQTMPTLLAITHNGPVRVREVGTGHQGIDWIVQPENFDSVIDMINQYGGPDAWTITPAAC